MLRQQTYRTRLRVGLGPARPHAPTQLLDSLASICCLWGPYRNLTTITAAAIGVHPGVRVLNHGGEYVFPDRRIDLLSDASPAATSRFVQFALDHQTGGVRGDRGGSIELSHAFDDATVSDAYTSRDVAETVECIVWKESQWLTNHLRSIGTTTGEAATANNRLRFVMPVRNPIACALSNIKTGHAARLPGVDRRSFADVIDVIVAQIFEFSAQARRHDENHVLFFEDDDPAHIASRLLALCGLTDAASSDSRAVDEVAALLVFRPSPEPTREQRQAFDLALRRHQASANTTDLGERLANLVSS